MDERELIQKKKEIEAKKESLLELKGEEKALISQLKTDWNCDTLEAAKIKIKSFEKKMESLSTKIKESTEILEDTYFNDEEE